ncbi:MAG: DUF4317 domain-containing protein [Lachnospiraceae bacterium]
MTKKDVSELKRRLKKEECTITRMCGCYVDGEKNKITQFGETFLNLEDEEFYKYLEIAGKSLSGTLGNHLLELEFPLDEELTGGMQQFLMGLKASRLKNEALLERLFDRIIEQYHSSGHYLILVFHDAYDVITKTSDQGKLDESEEVYEYLLCAICPVALSKPGLGYLSDENKIGPRIRDWVVGLPESGFLFPAFTDRSSDVHSILCYQKDPKTPHIEFMEQTLGCASKRTAAEQKKAFETIVKKAFGEDDAASKKAFHEIQKHLMDISESVTEDAEGTMNSIITSETIHELLSEADISQEAVSRICHSYAEEFDLAPPQADILLDAKAAAEGVKLKREQELAHKVNILEQQLEEKSKEHISKFEEPEAELPPDTKTFDVILRVKPEKAAQISSQIVNGRKCLVIPMEENEYAAVNGVNTKF